MKLIPDLVHSYSHMISNGKKYLQNKKIALTGICRNVETKLYSNIELLQTISNYCDINMFVYENDSTDLTSNILKDLHNKFPNFIYKSEILHLPSFGQTKENTRTKNLAKHRNICQKYIQDHLSDTDFTIVIDLDFQEFSIDGIFNSFGWISQKEHIDAMAGFSYEIKKFGYTNEKNEKIIVDKYWNYDSWAFRLNTFIDLQMYGSATNDPMYWFGLWNPPIGSSPISVHSAFGGCCIYKTKKYLSVNYEGYDCEHVCFHKNLSKSDEFILYANPSQIMIF